MEKEKVDPKLVEIRIIDWMVKWLIFARLYITIIQRKKMSKKKSTYHFSKIKEFDWDAGNIDKNEIKHDVKWLECEQIFFNKPLLFLRYSPFYCRRKVLCLWQD
jgi:hypothetical protein